jgi:hypothetical protein
VSQTYPGLPLSKSDQISFYSRFQRRVKFPTKAYARNRQRFVNNPSFQLFRFLSSPDNHFKTGHEIPEAVQACLIAFSSPSIPADTLLRSRLARSLRHTMPKIGDVQSENHAPGTGRCIIVTPPLERVCDARARDRASVASRSADTLVGSPKPSRSSYDTSSHVTSTPHSGYIRKRSRTEPTYGRPHYR